VTKEYPIIFNTEMVAAILDGRKTQTRRIPSSQNAKWKVGDRLWVKKRWKHGLMGGIVHETFDSPITAYWKLAGTLPRWASRITLEIVSLRREKLRAVTVEDVMAEGCPERDSCCSWFGRVWDNCYTQIGQRWTDNPEVQVVEFRRKDD